MRTLWILLFALACPAVSQELVLVTQVVCPPCKVAKVLLEKHKSSEAFAGYKLDEWNLLKDRAKIEALKIGKLVTTPTLQPSSEQVSTTPQQHLATLSMLWTL